MVVNSHHLWQQLELRFPQITQLLSEPLKGAMTSSQEISGINKPFCTPWQERFKNQSETNQIERRFANVGSDHLHQTYMRCPSTVQFYGVQSSKPVEPERLSGYPSTEFSESVQVASSPFTNVEGLLELKKSVPLYVLIDLNHSSVIT